MRNIVLLFWNGMFLWRYHDDGISLYVFYFQLIGENFSRPRSHLMKEGIAPCRDKFPQFICTIRGNFPHIMSPSIKEKRII